MIIKHCFPKCKSELNTKGERNERNKRYNANYSQTQVSEGTTGLQRCNTRRSLSAMTSIFCLSVAVFVVFAEPRGPSGESGVSERRNGLWTFLLWILAVSALPSHCVSEKQVRTEP